MKILKPIVLLFIITISTTELSGQEITMFSGFWGQKYYQDDQEITKKQLETFMEKNEALESYWKKSKVQGTLASIALFSEFGFAFWAGAEMAQGNDSTVPVIGTLGSATIAAIFFVSANNSKRKAILGYNKQLENRTSLHMVPIGNRDGVGLALKF